MTLSTNIRRCLLDISLYSAPITRVAVPSTEACFDVLMLFSAARIAPQSFAAPGRSFRFVRLHPCYGSVSTIRTLVLMRAILFAAGFVVTMLWGRRVAF